MCLCVIQALFQALVAFFCRHYIYNEEIHTFSSLGKLEFHNRCILTLNHIIFNAGISARTLCMLSAATDGRVAVWRIATELLVPNDAGTSGGARMEDVSTEDSVELAQPLAVCQAHQSGINDIAIQQGSHHTKALL